MRRMLIGGVVMAAATTLLACCATTGTKRPTRTIRTNVCQLSKSSAAFDGKSVILRAEVLSDLVEHTVLVSDQCPREAISLALLPAATGGEALKRAIVHGMP